jgi:hypothetical protein
MSETGTKGSNENTDKVKKDTTNNRAIDVFLLCSFSFIFSSLLLFFLSKLFFRFCSFDIFSHQEEHKNNSQKIELNWTKDVAYTNSEL